jgi:hypothetical protein
MNIRKPCFPQIVIATVVSLIGLPRGLPAWLQTKLPSQVERQQFSGRVPANSRLSFWIQAASSSRTQQPPFRNRHQTHMDSSSPCEFSDSSSPRSGHYTNHETFKLKLMRTSALLPKHSAKQGIQHAPRLSLTPQHHRLTYLYVETCFCTCLYEHHSELSRLCIPLLN